VLQINNGPLPIVVIV